MSGHSHSGHSHSGTSPGHGVAVEQGFVEREFSSSCERSILMRGAGEGRILFVDMPSGIAGDMMIASLVDLGVPLSEIEEAVDALGLPGLRLTLRSGYAGAIGCCHFGVTWSDQGRERSHAEIVELIQCSSLNSATKDLSLSIFSRLAKAEARVHRTSPREVHFHEVGAVDAIVDIVGAAAAFVYLGADVKASPVPLGRGFVRCRHGMLPLPAPATLECLEGIPTVPSGLQTELVTPTGAAIIATVAKEFGDWFSLVPERIGFGAGTRGLPDRPNAVRLVLGKAHSDAGAQNYVLLEANIDDMSAELASYALKQLLIKGALDAWIMPATMKKGRPGMVFCVLGSRSLATELTAEILSQTTSIGVRQSLVSRSEQPREIRTVNTQWGPVQIKSSGTGRLDRKDKAEFDDCAAIASREGIPVRIVLSEATRLAQSEDFLLES